MRRSHRGLHRIRPLLYGRFHGGAPPGPTALQRLNPAQKGIRRGIQRRGTQLEQRHLHFNPFVPAMVKAFQRALQQRHTVQNSRQRNLARLLLHSRVLLRGYGENFRRIFHCLYQH